QSAMVARHFAQPRDKSGRRLDGSRVADDGLENDASDQAGMARKRRFHSGEIVVRQRQRVHRSFIRHPRRTWNAERRHTAASLHQQSVGVAVVAALKLDKKWTPRKAARQAYRRHAGLCSRRNEAQLLNRRKTLLNQPRELRLGSSAGAKAGAALGGLLNGLHRGRKRMAQQHRPPGTEEVDVAVAVGVRKPGATGAGDKWWMTADSAKCADGRVDATGQQLLGAFLKHFRLS